MAMRILFPRKKAVPPDRSSEVELIRNVSQMSNQMTGRQNRGLKLVIHTDNKCLGYDMVAA